MAERTAAVNDEEVGATLAEVSPAKQLQIIQRVRAIANDNLRESVLLKDALRSIGKQFHSTTAPTSIGEDVKDQEVKDERLLVVGYGLGSFCASANAVHQLGFLVALMDALNNKCRRTTGAGDSANSEEVQPTAEIFDPAMNKVSSATSRASCEFSCR